MSENIFEKDKVLILCEGVSDIAFVFLLLNKILKCEYVNNYELSDLIKINTKFKDEYAWYENEDYYFLVASVKGCKNFNNFFELNIRETIKNKKYFSKIINIIDRDEKSIDEIEKSFKFDNLKFKNKKELINIYSTWSDEEYNISTFLNVVPFDKCGALEDAILDTIIAQGDKDIVEESINFIDSLDDNTKRYINKKRIISKAKVGVTFSLIAPDETFSSFSKRIDSLELDLEFTKETFPFLDLFIN